MHSLPVGVRGAGAPADPVSGRVASAGARGARAARTRPRSAAERNPGSSLRALDLAALGGEEPYLWLLLDWGDALPSPWPRLRRIFWGRAGLAAISILSVACATILELRTAWLQSLVFSRYAQGIGYSVEDGPSPAIRFPGPGPYDRRLGYSEIPSIVERAGARGYDVVAQARVSPRFAEVVDRGAYPIYKEKSQAGLRVLDRDNRPIYRAAYPGRAFASFDSIPPIVARTLLYIENRELLSRASPYANPAVEWDRMVGSLGHLGRRLLGSEESVPGASTLATQIEKVRHSPDGVTRNVEEKLRQMASASLRTYWEGRVTEQAQRRIVLDYVNSIPLAAIAGYGEVTGLGDGLWVWYGLDVNEIWPLLSDDVCPGAGLETEQGAAYRAVLSLFLAHRRPTYYLGSARGREALSSLTDRHLALLEANGVISSSLAERARSARLELRDQAPPPPPISFVERKAANTVRVELLDLVGGSRLYDLDRYDLTVRSTIDGAVQREVTERLRRLRDPAYVDSAGLRGSRLLGGVDPAPVVYSLVLYEATPRGNVLRVQADNVASPFDPNVGAKLELGSTAKLRTLVSYLEVIEELHGRLAGEAPDQSAAYAREHDDPLTRWAHATLRAEPGLTVQELLRRAMERRYSASPHETFLTGGAPHTFTNFDRTFDGGVLTVTEGFRHSVNLVFIRMMRDVIQYHAKRLPGAAALARTDPSDSTRAAYLARFADHEGRIFVRRFYEKHRGRQLAESVGLMFPGQRPSALRIARAYRAVLPTVEVADLKRFLDEHGRSGRAVSDGEFREVLRRSSPDGWTLNDVAYLAGVHPLELWVVRHLLNHTEASLHDVLRESAPVRQEVYGWLFGTSRRGAQDTRIQTVLEIEAFAALHRRWVRLGYPFDHLVPSYATAIGSSADRPSALAELLGILVNDGVRRPSARIDELLLAEHTPYETRLGRRVDGEERVLSVEVVRSVRAALVDVVERGTARRLQGAFRMDGECAIEVGGKTGTGDNRPRMLGAGRTSSLSRPMNRTSSLAFYVGDRLFGVIAAYVDGPDADQYRFTSALPAQVLRHLAPTLMPLLQRQAADDLATAEVQLHAVGEIERAPASACRPAAVS